jgi:23S rRNA (cytosine1962-C5)-methyltransferase
MWKAEKWKDYEVLDTSDGEKLERWGKYYLVRPDPQVIWFTPKEDRRWRDFDARYARSNSGGGQWSRNRLPERWQIRYRELTFNVKPMNFKHTGVFPEQAANWDFIDAQIRSAGRRINVLNLFAYTGGATLAPQARRSAMWTRRRAWSHGPRKTPLPPD